MDLMKLFEEYLPKWSEEKMQPIPTKDQPDRWALAWKDFQDNYLKEIHEELVQEYKSMELKTYGMLEHKKKEKPVEQKVVENKELSEWEKVQKFLN